MAATTKCAQAVNTFSLRQGSERYKAWRREGCAQWNPEPPIPFPRREVQPGPSSSQRHGQCSTAALRLGQRPGRRPRELPEAPARPRGSARRFGAGKGPARSRERSCSEPGKVLLRAREPRRPEAPRARREQNRGQRGGGRARVPAQALLSRSLLRLWLASWFSFSGCFGLFIFNEKFII